MEISQELTELIIKGILDQLTKKEEVILRTWLDQDQENKIIFETMNSYWKQGDGSLEKVKSNLRNRIRANEDRQLRKVRKKRTWRVAASFGILLSIAAI